MEPTVYILGAGFIAIVSGVVGRSIGSNGKVKDVTCGERRLNCNKLVDEKLQHMDKKLDLILNHVGKTV